jgi:hypothetical protein
MKEFSGFGDHAVATMQSSVTVPEGMGIEGFYEVVCHDAEGNLKWEEKFPNLVVAVGKQLMLDTLLRTSGTYTTVGPYLGLISGASPAFTAADTMSSHAGWTEFIAYTTTGSAIRGTAGFTASTSSGSSPANTTTSTATAITYTITGAGGTVGGCFLVTGSGASSTQNNTSGTLYSAGAFATPKVTTVGDTVSVTYSTTATS